MEFPRVQSIEVPGPAGRLEALLRCPARPPAAAALLCHPHPLYRGTMHNPVLFRTARAYHGQGQATLRFNFRGVGLSAGRYDSGRGEQQDVEAVVGYLAKRFPGLSLTLVGYSFGAMVGLRAAASDPRISRLVGIGLPLSLESFDFLGKGNRPLLIIQGERDRLGSGHEMMELLTRLNGRARLVEISGADHFFRDRLDEFEQALTRELARPDWPPTRVRKA